MKIVYSGLHNNAKVSGEIERDKFLSSYSVAELIFYKLTKRDLARCHNWYCCENIFKTKSGKDIVSIRFELN